MSEEHVQPVLEFDPFAGPAILATVATTEPQREIWTAAQVSDDATLAYNESVTLWMRGPLDLEALRAALAEVVDRHEALRSTFSADGLTMIVAAHCAVPLDVVDATGHAPDAVEAEWKALLDKEVGDAFDLLRGPLARAKIFRVASDEHRVTFTGHHIVCDGWSTAVIVRDWAALYSAHVRGIAATLPPAGAFSVYAREQSARPAANDDEAYWVSRYVDGVPILELPLDRPRPPLKTYASRREDWVLDEPLVRDLRKVGSADRASLFVTLLAGFEVLLTRLSGQSDLVVGIPAAGQSVGGHDELVGHCVNMLPFRGRVDTARSFRALLTESRSSVLDAYDHQELTFGSLLKRLPLARDPSRLPLVSVVFNLDRGLSDEAMAFEGLRTSLTANPRLFENFDVFVNAVELGGRVTLECQYNADLFEAATIRRWLGTFQRLLRSICDSPEEKIGWLPILTEDQADCLQKWNAEAARDIPRGACTHDLIEAQIARTPNATAVDFEGTRLTYAELDARSEALAFRLRELGVARGSLVGLCVERSPDLVIGLLGILKAGGAYVPLDPGYPIDRLAFMVKDSGMRSLVTQKKVRAELPLDAPNIVLVDDIAGRTDRVPSDGDAMPEDPAYVIYTSGSTGTPKGVLVPHRAVVNLLASVQETPGMTGKDTVLAVTTLSFDIAVSEILLPLTVGARIALASREVASDGDRLLTLLHSSKATFLDATPSTWRLLLTAGWQGGEHLKAICTGEALPSDLARELVKRCDTVWNGYGPTETTVWSGFWQVTAPVGRILIGKPIANTLFYVLDASMQRVPVGVVGELFIGGEGVTLGYHDRPDLTRERFLADPFAGGNARMYKTGDLVRFLPDGNMECLGRNDSQVKLRGYRIELGEIENVLGQHPHVSSAAVIVREDNPGDRRLVAYVVWDAAQGGVSDQDLRSHLKKTLPDYMVPQLFVPLEKMPSLPNGKIDRRKLPVPQVTRSTSSDEFVAPRTPTEQMLAKLWEEVLSVGRIGAEDDFFALGGHSLLASQVIARLRRDHNVEVSFRRMFEAPTVSKLAAAIDTSAKAPPSEKASKLLKRAPAVTAPLSVAQRRMWLLEEMNPEQRLVHNLCASWRLTGKLDVAALERTVAEIVRRHDVLRTNIRLEKNDPVQVVHHDRTIAVRSVDLSPLPDPEGEAALNADRDGEAIVPFDLASDPLIRITLFKLADDCHVLSMVQHNIIWDGWSFDLFLRELCAIYPAFARKAPSPLAPLPIAYADFAQWQAEWIGSQHFESHAAFWRAQSLGATLPLEIPTDRPRKGTRSHAGSNVGLHLPATRAKELEGFAREHGSTLFMVVFAAFNVLLHRRTGQSELCVGTPMRARTQPELEDVIGLFVNTVALKTVLDPSMTFLDLLDRVREGTLDAFTHQEVPLDALGVRPPMLRALFSLQDATSRPPELGDVRISQEHALAPVAASELMLWVMESRSSLLLMLNFATDLFDATTARRWLREFETLLDQVQRDPKQRIGSIPILPAEEVEFIATSGGEPTAGGPGLLPLVQAIAARTPDAPALGCDGRALTYRQLLRRVATTAHDLVARGAGAGARVAIQVAAGDDLVVATLAVLAVKAEIALKGATPTLVLETIPAGADRDDLPLVTSSAHAVAFVEDGATVSEASLSRSLRALAAAATVRPSDTVVVARVASNAGALSAMLLPLVAGARLVVAPAVDPDAFRGAVASAHADVVLGEPGVFRALEGVHVAKAVVLGRLPEALAAKLTPSIGELYVSEITPALGVPASLHRVTAPDERHLLGRPLTGTMWCVVGPEGEAAPIGVTGDLVVDLGEGPCRTGDRARLLADGSFEHLGRTDGRIGLRDGLVDPAGIAKVLAGHRAVREASVLAHEDAAGELRLVAYYAHREGVSCTETELRTLVRGSLGDAQVPRLFVELDALPRDASGRVDAERLPSPYALSGTQEYVAPRSDAEKYMAGVWKEALNIARIGVYDNFFDLGGHSLLCFRIIARIEQDKGKRISPRAMLLNTLEQVSAQLDGAADRPRAAAAPHAPKAGAESPKEADRPIGGAIRGWLKRIVKG